MKNIVTSIDISHSILDDRYKKLCSNLEEVAKVALGSRYVQEMVPHVEFDSAVRLSDDFTDGYTTILDADDLNTYFTSGQYGETVRRQCLVSICAYAEVFVSTLFPIMKLNEHDGKNYGQFPNDFNLEIHNSNSFLRKIYYIYKKLKGSLDFETSNWENIQCPRMLDEMFTIRHVIVHFGGVIAKSDHEERIGGHFKDANNNIILSPNSIDDFVHRVTINLSGLVKKIDTYLS